ncbi:hypothetical protein PBY51_019170 [Eleginops maclovinus]|uniref:Uncharacterized protein n=1 Tax=Eleginops maclovinus TaxID=56733 RepID=A0AAN7Y1T2_ELEMC|nr:hypothetical protein PBY51_019170 [Eleginops maclovinus]
MLMEMMMWEDEVTSCGATGGEGVKKPGPVRRDTIKYPTHSISGWVRNQICSHNADDRVSMYHQQFFRGSVFIVSVSAGYSSKIVIPLSDAADSQ